MTEKLEKKRKLLQEDLKENGWYCNLKEDTLDGSVCRTPLEEATDLS